MYTRCPECETMFHLSVEDLRQAGGRVRCGECAHVFYGMDFLAEEANDDTGQFEVESRVEATDLVDNTDPSSTDSATPDEAGIALPRPDGEDEDAPSPDEILYTSDDESTEESDDDADDDDEVVDDLTADSSSATESEEISDTQDEIGDDVEDDTGDYTEPDADEDDEAELEYDAEAQYDDVEPEPDPDFPDREEYDDAEKILYSVVDGAQLGDEDGERQEVADASLADADLEDDVEDDSEYGIDDTIWERIPGVGTLTPDIKGISLPDMHQDDTGAFLTSLDDADEDADEDGHGLDGESESMPAGDSAPDEADQDAHIDASIDMEADAAAEADTNLEFNIPEEKWPTVFETSADLDTEEEGLVVTEPGNTKTRASIEQSPPWQFNKYRNIDLSSYDSSLRFWVICVAVLGAMLAGQLMHYNRDSLATDPEYGDQIRAIYTWFDLPLYPRWSVEDYEIRGSEAVVGETGTDVMDIRTQIAAIGNHPVGLPILRVILRDRWSNPVAARNFTPAEYAVAEDIPANLLLEPNTSLAARLSIIDPGSGAQGYELELCVPHRDEKMQCSGQAFK